ncbi:hypothetical protein GDO78_001384 [Eleutherodactylus coqui]|uniref:Uncharacterized protein n=1 Tax=Eleutherodactylus coqui TaxID=57060 RepID=A0A8J6KGX4_ELECQ|nr:hypothetical protein GDO78_001384 [Eleutherodactylus coqui]
MLLCLLLLLLLPQRNDSDFIAGSHMSQSEKENGTSVWTAVQSEREPENINDSYNLQVKFSSRNFKNILTWSTTNKKEGIRYNVMYKLYGNNSWIKKAECTNITQNWCDLTNETSFYEEQYYGMVNISNEVPEISKQSDKFDPLSDTILDPPKVNIYSDGTSITINLTHFVEHLSGFYGGIDYEFEISGQDPVKSREPYLRIKLSSQTRYCVSARLVNPKSIQSNKTCIDTEPGPTDERGKIMISILAVILLIFTVFCAGYSVHKYIYVGNLQQPQILNITSNNNNNVILVDAHNVTINVITIESGKSNEQSTSMDDKEEKTQLNKDLLLKDFGYDASHALGVTKDDDHGYITLREQVPATRPQVIPYDMPHEISVKPPIAPSLVGNKEKDVYGRIKCNSNIVSIQEKYTVEAHQKADMPTETVTYLPKNDQHVPKLDVLNHTLYGINKSSIGEDVVDGADYSECDSLFIDWSPTSRHLYIPNFHTKPIDKVSTEECQEDKVLLPHLYKPIQTEETSEELSCLEQRWGLHVKMQE